MDAAFAGGREHKHNIRAVRIVERSWCRSLGREMVAMLRRATKPSKRRYIIADLISKPFAVSEDLSIQPSPGILGSLSRRLDPLVVEDKLQHCVTVYITTLAASWSKEHSRAAFTERLDKYSISMPPDQMNLVLLKYRLRSALCPMTDDRRALSNPPCEIRGLVAMFYPMLVEVSQGHSRVFPWLFRRFSPC